MRLNENHLRRLTTSMNSVNAAATHILKLLADDPTTSRMVIVDRSSLTVPEQARILELVAGLQEMAVRFAGKYDLRPPLKDLRRIVNAQLSQVWTTLENTHTAKMKGMGRVPKEVADSIDQDVDEMLSQVEKILRALKVAE